MTKPTRRKGGLGRGLASLIPTGPADGGPRLGEAAADVVIGGSTAEGVNVGAVYREIDPALIEPNPRQPRQVFDEEALAELVHSIREFGLMQPIVVREVAAGGRYQLVMGERRWRASQQAGLTSIPAIVRDTADDNLLRDALLEVAAGVLSAGHARALLALEAGPEAQEELAARIVAEGLSVRATEEAVTLANRDDPKPPKPSRRKPIQMPGLQDIAERISRSYDTRVTVSLGKRKGKIVVEFGSVEDLQRIVGLMDPNAKK